MGKFLTTLMLLLFLIIGVTTKPVLATGVYDMPYLSVGSDTWVIDNADALSIANEGNLNNSLGNLAKKTGQEVRMVTIRRLDFDQTIDTFIDQLFNKWFPTTEEQSNQTLLVMDTLTNNVAIRTGSEVKSIMADDIANSIVEDTIGVPLREGSKYNQAFMDARTRLVAILSGEADPGPPDVKQINVAGTFTSAEDTDDRSATIWVVILLVLATIIPMATYFFYVGFN
jgi:uncharacterized protein